jgi:hypothetical protein
MFQFREEDTALQAAKVLAVYERTPVLVMTRGFLNVFSIGPWNSPSIHQAGRHMATVHSTGQVELHCTGM